MVANPHRIAETRRRNPRRSNWKGNAALALIATAAALLACWTAKPHWTRAADAGNPGETGQPRRVKVLWLGDKGHHNPLDRCRQVYSVLGKDGIDLTYTEEMSDLNPQNLGRYDCLLLYANIERIAPDQEKALLDYVESGHGFVPIHCGSFCFLNSPKITAMTGGRFKSHSTGVFKETIVQPDHPIERGLSPIESWDETYVHNMHNEEGRTVLGYREDASGKEPYTWVRNQGKGRVFYTAWGHDQRTWGNKDFQALLERGIRWAAGDWALQPRPTLKPFEYSTGSGVAALPNYLPDKPWGTVGDLITRIQQPAPPDESVKHMAVPPGFEVRLVTSEPDVKKPICMAFDERGRLWVAETFDYPNQMQPDGQGRDRITICEDTDGDGRADKFTIFADKLSIPTSMVFANGGVIVSQPPHMLFFKDLDGDGKADKPEERKILFTGWGTRDTHATASNLRWGLDGWIYGTVGYSGFRGTVGGEQVSFGQGLFRFKPDGSKLEFLGSTNNNTWGLGLSEDFEVFASTANHNPAFYLGVPNRYFETVRGFAARRPATIADDWHFWPITDKVRQVDQHGGYTAGAGAALYTARTYPKDYWNRINFVSEPTGHLVGQFIMQPRGSGFVAENNFNLLASDDEWTAPIAAEVGPDGQVWVIDWYNIIVQHNPVPRGFSVGKGAAYETPLRDKRHGRVYRLVYKDGKPSPTLDLSKASPAQLVEALKSENMLWRTHAQRLLVEHGNKDVAPQLIALAADTHVDEAGLNAPAIHALWALHDLGALDGSNADATAAAVKALTHPSAAVRKTALLVLPRTPESLAVLLKSNLLRAREPLVQRAAMLALSEMPAGGNGSDEVGTAVYTALTSMKDPGATARQGRRGAGGANAANAPGPTGAAALAARGGANPLPEDTSLFDATVIAAARHDAAFLKALLSANPAKEQANAGASAQPKEQDKAQLAAAPAKPGNLLPNPSFEQGENGRPTAWMPRAYSGPGAKSEWADVGRTGGHSLMISSDRGTDSGWFCEVRCEPNTDYRLSAWIKTENVQKVGGAQGALLNIHNLQAVKTPAVTGTSDWKKVEVAFNSGSETTLGINCLFGGWGRATGTAWYDDVELVKAAGSSAENLPGAVGRAVPVVAASYAHRAPADSVMSVLSTLKRSDPAVAAAVLDGLAAGWPDGSPPKLTAADASEIQSLMTALNPDARDRLLALAGRWGRKELFSQQLAQITADLQKAVQNASLDAAQRADAAQRLLTVADTPASVDLVLGQVNPQTPPDVQTALLQAAAESRSPAVAESLIKRWGTLTPTAQKGALALMLRREPWTQALVAGIESGAINPKDLLPQQWQALTGHYNRELAEKARVLQNASGRGVSADRKAIVEKFLPVAQQTGDPAKGRLVFEKNCIVCHTIEGTGGKVGPELTGIGAKPKAENLIDILDPNRSVEGTYRQWMARTEDDVIAGRLLTESKTSVEIIDPAGQTHVLQRDQIKSLTASDKSVMPEGFEQLPPEDLTNLLEYLATSKVKH